MIEEPTRRLSCIRIRRRWQISIGHTSSSYRRDSGRNHCFHHRRAPRCSRRRHGADAAQRRAIVQHRRAASVRVCGARCECHRRRHDNPRHLASLEASTRSCAEAFAFDLEDDDVVLTNDPYGGAPSIHYFTVVAPVRIGNAISAYVAVQGHMGDIGGIVMGNYDPEAREVRTEGVRLTPLKIVKLGRRRRDVVDTIILNSRLPERLAGDLEAMIAAIGVGRHELEALAGAHGSQIVLDAMRTAIEYAERRLRIALARVPAGEHLGCATLATNAVTATVRVTLSRVGSDTILDFTGSDPQLPTFVNCTRDTTRTHALLPLARAARGRRAVERWPASRSGHRH